MRRDPTPGGCEDAGKMLGWKRIRSRPQVRRFVAVDQVAAVVDECAVVMDAAAARRRLVLRHAAVFHNEPGVVIHAAARPESRVLRDRAVTDVGGGAVHVEYAAAELGLIPRDRRVVQSSRRAVAVGDAAPQRRRVVRDRGRIDLEVAVEFIDSAAFVRGIIPGYQAVVDECAGVLVVDAAARALVVSIGRVERDDAVVDAQAGLKVLHAAAVVRRVPRDRAVIDSRVRMEIAYAAAGTIGEVFRDDGVVDAQAALHGVESAAVAAGSVARDNAVVDVKAAVVDDGAAVAVRIPAAQSKAIEPELVNGTVPGDGEVAERGRAFLTDDLGAVALNGDLARDQRQARVGAVEGAGRRGQGKGLFRQDDGVDIILIGVARRAVRVRLAGARVVGVVDRLDQRALAVALDPMSGGVDGNRVPQRRPLPEPEQERAPRQGADLGIAGGKQRK